VPLETNTTLASRASSGSIRFANRKWPRWLTPNVVCHSTTVLRARSLTWALSYGTHSTNDVHLRGEHDHGNALPCRVRIVSKWSDKTFTGISVEQDLSQAQCYVSITMLDMKHFTPHIPRSRRQ